MKDAASSAIYGSRAANGVILITTRRGKSGEAKISYNGYVTMQKVANHIDLVSNYADYMELYNEGQLNSDLPRSSAKRKSTNGGLLVTVIQSNIRILTGRTLYFRLDGCRTIRSISTEDLTKFTIIYPVIT